MPDSSDPGTRLLAVNTNGLPSARLINSEFLLATLSAGFAVWHGLDTLEVVVSLSET